MFNDDHLLHLMSAFASFFVMRLEPFAGLFQTIFNRCELKLWIERAQFTVGGGFLELSVAFAGIEDDFSLEIHRLGDVMGHIRDGDFVLFTDRQNDRFRRVILTQHPDSESGKVQGKDKLTQRTARAPNGQIRVCRQDDPK